MRECLDGMEVHRPPLFDDGDLFDLLTESGFRARKETLCDTSLYDVLADSTAITALGRAEGRCFDLVTAYDWLAALAGMMVAGKRDLPFVFHVHSTEQGRHGGEGSVVRQTIERPAAARADLVGTVSYAMGDELIRLGYDGSRIRTVYKGVDPAKYNLPAVSPGEAATLCSRLGRNGRERVLRRFAWVHAAEGTAAVHRDAVTQHRTAAQPDRRVPVPIPL